ncbi:MAG: hypothetical protein ACRELB_21190 [Polyangiaceae bacterium]
MKPRHYADVAAAVLVIEAAFAVTHCLTGGQYGGCTRSYSIVMDVGFAAVWLAAAVATVVRRSFPALFLATAGAGASLMMAFLFSVAAPGTGAGLPFLLATGVVAAALVLALPGWHAAETPHHPHAARHWFSWARHHA